jgi:hypothetical protein
MDFKGNNLQRSRFFSEFPKEFITCDVNKSYSTNRNVENFFDSKRHEMDIKPKIYINNNTTIFNVDDSVVHRIFGLGVIVSVNDDTMDIFFKSP